MNKRGFTLIELLVSFTLITIVSLSLFKTVLTVQKKAQKDLSYNQYLSFAASFSSNLQKDFTGDKITSFSSCGTNCYDIVYANAGTKEIKIDRTNNIFSYGSIKEKLPNNYVFYGDLILSLNKIDGMPADNYNSILTLTVPIKSNLSQSFSNITYTYQYDDREGEAPAAVFRTLTVNPNGGTYAGSTSNTEYYLLETTSQELSIPMRQNYIFNGWSKTCTTCLVGNTYTVGAIDDTLTAQWLLISSAYTYTGSSAVESDASGNWKIKFLTGGTFTPLVSMTIDVFLVGGGGGGGTYATNYNLGAGGGGGYTATHKSIALTLNQGYSIVVGAGGDPGVNGSTSSGFDKSIGGGYAGGNSRTSAIGGAGGSGGGLGQNYAATNGGSDGSTSSGAGQGSTTREFGEVGATLYAGGGGGGNWDGTPGTGGAGGGGNGAKNYAATAGTANTGGGGGGRADAVAAGGGSGIVIIRNTR